MCWSGCRRQDDGSVEIGDDALDVTFAVTVEGLVDEPVTVDGGEEVGLRELLGVEVAERPVPAVGVGREGRKPGARAQAAKLCQGCEAVDEVGRALDEVRTTGGGVLFPAA